MNPDELRPPIDIEAILNPAERARAAGDEITKLALLEHEYSTIRWAAVNELRENGLSHADVAEELGVSRSRAAAIATTTPQTSGVHMTGGVVVRKIGDSPTLRLRPLGDGVIRTGPVPAGALVRIVCAGCGNDRIGTPGHPGAYECPTCGSTEVGYIE